MKLKNKKIIFKIGATIFFVIALITVLKLLFNTDEKMDIKRITGTWYIEYKFYEGEDTDSKEVNDFIQELHINKDNTFYTSQKNSDEKLGDSTVSGTYKISNDNVILEYKQNGSVVANTLYYNESEDKLCLNPGCDTFYTHNVNNTFFVEKNYKG